MRFGQSLRRRLRGERGIGLVELLVSMLLLGVVSAIVAGLYVSTMRTVAQAKTLTGNTREASNGMNEVTRVIRAATEYPILGQAVNDPAIESATKESVTVYAYVNLDTPTQQPVKIQLALDAERRLVETQWASIRGVNGYYSFETTPKSVRILAATVAPAGAVPLFRYLDGTGAALFTPMSGITDANRARIASVTVNLTVQSSLTDAGSAVSLHNTVGMPNLGLSGAGS